MSSKKFISWNPALCSGCRLCELVCSFRRGNGISPSTSAIRVEEEKIFVCRQCRTPACKGACRSGAMAGEIDPTQCTGCGLCVSACTYEAIFQPLPKTPPIKCNLCEGDPECVRMCPSGALKLARKGRLAFYGMRLADWQRSMLNEIFLRLATGTNHRITMLARRRIVRMRAGQPDGLMSRMVLTPLLKPFTKNFYSPEDNR